MNDPEKRFGFGHHGPRKELILAWLDRFQHSASPFVMERTVDHNGQSGTGTVADGVVFPDGRVNIRWRSGVSGVSQTENWDELPHALRIHGHRGDTFVTVIPVSDIVDALADALSVHGMMEVTDDPVGNAFADGWNACRQQVEFKVGGRLRAHFETTVAERTET